MTYRVKLLKHLADYRRTTLDVPEDGVWARNKRRYPHLLPAELRELNLLPEVRDACSAYMTSRRKTYHRDFHHLNSSQAFALNLFFPYLEDDGGHPVLMAALKLRGAIDWWEFEAVPDPSEGTNFDVLLGLTDGSKVYIEVKLTETGFGSARINDERRRKLNEVYRPRLVGKVRTSFLEEQNFFQHYQLMRNLSYIGISPDAVVLLILPRANSAASDAVAHFHGKVLVPEYRPHVAVLHAEDVAAALLEHAPQSSATSEATRALIDKYMLMPVSIDAV